jgi:hypothetical protein
MNRERRRGHVDDYTARVPSTSQEAIIATAEQGSGVGADWIMLDTLIGGVTTMQYSRAVLNRVFT